MKYLCLIFLLTCGQAIDTNKINADPELKAWKSDKYGCKKIRTEAKAIAFISKYKIRNASVDHLKLVLGEPNKIKQSNSKNRLFYLYYYNADCDQGEFNEEKAHCWLEIEIDGGSELVKHINFWCK